jgi:uncharacterized protein YdeI (YjbR/CyaY-like superfamily)
MEKHGKFFKSQDEFRKWLERNHKKAKEVFVGFYKTSSDKKGITYQQALDEALCFGWIDGIRYNIDEISYKIRFTPRKKISKWSKVNIERANELLKLGKMKPAGINAFENRGKGKSIRYSYEERIEKLSKEYENLFRRNGKAWDFFQKQAPYYKRISSFWVMSAKKTETQERRLKTLIKNSEDQKRIDLLNPKIKSGYK